MGSRNPQQSMDKGFFYVFASKKGTVKDEFNEDCVVGNYMPAWVTPEDVFTYKVPATWVDALWRHYKLDDAVYQGLYLCCLGGCAGAKAQPGCLQSIGGSSCQERAAEKRWFKEAS